MPSLDFSNAWPWLQWLLAITAVVAFLAGAIKGIPPAWRAISTFVTTINSLQDLPAELSKQRQFRAEVRTTLSGQDKTLADQNLLLAKQDTKVGEIHHEVHFNNGSSVKDGIARVEEGVAGLYKVTETLQKELDALKKGKTDE